MKANQIGKPVVMKTKKYPDCKSKHCLGSGKFVREFKGQDHCRFCLKNI